MNSQKTIYRHYFDKKLKTLSPKVIADCISMLRDYLGITPYPEQVKAAKLLYKQNIVDQKTGEGKTISILLAALFILRDHRRLYISTANEYLAKRDWKYSLKLLSDLGYESIFIPDSIGITEDEYKRGDIFYATGQALIFDYLRGVRADYDFALLDEIDYTLVECAGNSFSVSDSSEEVFFPVNLYEMVKEVADFFEPSFTIGTTPKADILFDLQYQSDVIVNTSEKKVSLTERGYNLLEELCSDFLQNPDFLEVLLATLTAKFLYHEGVDYIIEDDKLTIVDFHSGRKTPNSNYEVALHTAIEVKEGLAVKAKAVFSNTCSYTVFFSLFKSLSGISGTASYVPFDFNKLYAKNTVKVSEHIRNKREEIYEYLPTDEDRLKRIYEIAETCDTPLLIVTDSDKRSQLIASSLSTLEKRVILLDNYNLDQEQYLLDELKESDAVLISSKIVGRGTDITVSEKFGGLTLVLSIRFPSVRAERQIIGRTARNGRRGKCYIITSRDDPIFDRNPFKKAPFNESTIRKIQGLSESKDFEARKLTYIITKLFHIHSESIEGILSGFADTDQMYSYLGEEQHGERILISDAMRRLLLHDYRALRPWYQGQFLQYTYSMSSLLFKEDSFNEMNKNYILMSKDITKETIRVFLKQIGSM